MAASLSSHDVARLMAEPSPDVRAELAGKVAADLSGSGLTAAEVKLAQDIVRALARDMEEKVRASLSRGLRHSPHLPRDVALKLAQDIDFVALPMLADSLVLTDEDLIEIVRHGSALEAGSGREPPQPDRDGVGRADHPWRRNRRSPC